MEQRTTSVIFSHYVPINVLVGRAMGSAAITCFNLDYASVTLFDAENLEVRVIQRGRDTQSRAF